MPRYIADRIKAVVYSHGPDGMVTQEFTGSNWKAVRKAAHQFAVGHTIRGKDWYVAYTKQDVYGVGPYKIFREARGTVAVEHVHWKIFLDDGTPFSFPDGKKGEYVTRKSADNALRLYACLLPQGRRASRREVRY